MDFIKTHKLITLTSILLAIVFVTEILGFLSLRKINAQVAELAQVLIASGLVENDAGGQVLINRVITLKDVREAQEQLPKPNPL